MKRWIHRSAFACALALAGFAASAQCTNYTITVGGGLFNAEIDWELVNDGGVTVASGIAPQTVAVCLPNGCYTMYMYDAFGDGWNGASFVIRIQPANTIVASGTLSTGFFGTAQVNLGGGCGGANCTYYQLNVTGGTFPGEISWNLVSGVQIVGTGFAPTTMALCLDTGCFVMQMFDDFGDGWNGATWTLTNEFGTTVGTGTLATGTIGSQMIDLSPTTTCASSSPVTASDCPLAVNICTNYNWAIDPNGIGALNEIPVLGSLGNPDLQPGGALAAWGTDNWGCLRNNELNSTWMIINISGGGTLEFTFGGLGSQAGFYDWIMYPYTPGQCSNIMANTVPPIRCNWNGVSTGGTGLASVVPGGGSPLNFEPPLTVLAGQQYVICFSNWSSVTTFVPLDFGGSATVSCQPIILPLELLTFTAQQEGDAVQLDWTTASESGSDRFVIERMRGTQDWTDVGSVEAAGASTQDRQYRFTDAPAPPGHLYYRLRMMDADGAFSYSPTVSVHCKPQGPSVYPNPTSGAFWVRNANAPMRVQDAMGRDVEYDVVLATDEVSQIQLKEGRPGLFTVLIGADGCLRAERVMLR